jgi:hypothetical protein
MLQVFGLCYTIMGAATSIGYFHSKMIDTHWITTQCVVVQVEPHKNIVNYTIDSVNYSNTILTHKGIPFTKVGKPDSP